jgi:DNA-binding HxlR family transcriptional regulator
MRKRLISNYFCPTEFALDVLGGKWKTVILCYLSVRAMKYSELRRFIPQLSDKVLSERLHELAASGLISRSPRSSTQVAATYTLTARGRSLRGVLLVIYEWGVNNARTFGVKVGEPLKARRMTH